MAEPLIAHDKIDDPPIEEISPELLLPVIVLRRIIVEGAERIGKATLKVFKKQPKPKDILNPNGKPIGRRGNSSRVRVQNGGIKLHENFLMN